MVKVLQDYIVNPPATCKNWVRKQQEKAGTVGNEKQRVKYTEQWYAKAVAKRELRRSKVPQPDERSKLSQ